MITDAQKQALAAYFAAQPVDAAYLFGSQDQINPKDQINPTG